MFDKGGFESNNSILLAYGQQSPEEWSPSIFKLNYWDYARGEFFTVPNIRADKLQKYIK